MAGARVHEGAEPADLATPVSRGTTGEVGLPTGPGADARSLRPAQVLALQRSIGNSAVARLLQRQVRVNGGRQRVDEAHYKTGPGKNLGLRRSISGLIDDGIRRVFVDTQELEDYANGLTDYIGDVTTASAGTFWYRLPKDKLTVLGEYHHAKDGNVEDVIRGLRTSRFMYEPFNEMADTKALPLPYTGMRAKLDEVNKGISISGFADPKKFDPHLENIVVKAVTGAAIFRNEFVPGKPTPRDDPEWKARASTSDYSMGERVALYLSFGIHIAKDVAEHDFGPDNDVESLFVHTARQLKETYLRHRDELDAFMKAKDTDPLIGIYELTVPGGYSNLAALKAISLALHEYGAYYIKQLGGESTSAELEAQGEALVGNLGANLDALGPLRDLMMWQKIQGAKGYLLVGMGDAHREGLKDRLNAAGIPHERVDQALVRQRDAINAVWAP